MRWIAPWLLLVSLASCEARVPEGRFACEDDGDCPAEMVCRSPEQRCFSSSHDARQQDDGGMGTDSER